MVVRRRPQATEDVAKMWDHIADDNLLATNQREPALTARAWSMQAMASRDPFKPNLARRKRAQNAQSVAKRADSARHRESESRTDSAITSELAQPSCHAPGSLPYPNGYNS